jgi:O-antigen/teichoic acid export membrane protein
MLPKSEVGAFFLLMSIVYFAVLLAQLGMKQTIVKLVAEAYALGNEGRIAHTIMLGFAVVGSGCVVVLATYALGLGTYFADFVFKIPEISSATTYTLVWVAMLSFHIPLVEGLRGLHKIATAVIFDDVMVKVILAASLTLIWLGGHSLTFRDAVMLAALSAGASLFATAVVFKRAFKVSTAREKIDLREIPPIALPLYISQISNYGITNFSLWLVAGLYAPDEVASYGAAWKLVALVVLPLTLMRMSVQPVISELYTKQQAGALQNALRGIATLAAIPAICVLMVFIFFGDRVLDLVYGSAYVDGYDVLVVLCLGQIVNAWTGVSGQVLALSGHQRVLMRLTIISGVITVVLSVLGNEFLGVIGIALGVTCGRILQAALEWQRVLSKLGLRTHATLNLRFVREAALRVIDRKSVAR